MGTIPVDILVSEILIRLPIKQLIRCKCIAKSFRSLISSPEFINLHLRYSLDFHTTKLYVQLQGRNAGLQSLDLTSLESSTIELPFSVASFDAQRFVGSSNGLHCVAYSRYLGNRPFIDYVVYNPCIGIYKKITYCLLEETDIYEGIGVGFGFDNVNNDYKIVMLVLEKMSPCEIVVYSLKANSWREIGVQFNASAIRFRSAVVMENGFHVMFRHRHETRIGTFDITSEQWSEHVLPLNSKQTLGVIELGVIDGRLYVCNDHWPTHEEKYYEFWVMEEYGVKESWSKVLVFAHGLKILRHITPICYSKASRDEILLWNWFTRGLICYNVRAKTFSITNINSLSFWPKSRLFVCNETLVNIPGGKSRP